MFLTFSSSIVNFVCQGMSRRSLNCNASSTQGNLHVLTESRIGTFIGPKYDTTSAFYLHQGRSSPDSQFLDFVIHLVVDAGVTWRRCFL